MLAKLGKVLQAQAAFATREAIQVALVDLRRLPIGKLLLTRFPKRLAELVDYVLLHAARASYLATAV